MCGTGAEPASQPFDLVNTVGPERWAPRFSCRLGRVAGSVPGFTAFQAQCAQGLTQQRPFLVTQAFYRLWLGQDIILRINRVG
jgi:hypothetical protein